MAIKPAERRDYTYTPNYDHMSRSENVSNLAKLILRRFSEKAGKGYCSKDLDHISNLLFEHAFAYIQRKDLLIDKRLFHELIRSIDKIDETAIKYLEYFFEHTPIEMCRELIRNRYFYTALLDQCKKSPQLFNLASKVFEEAVKSNQYDTMIYNQYIKITGNNNNFLLADYCYNRTLCNSTADRHTFFAYINAAARNNKYKEANDALEVAKKYFISISAILEVYICYMNAAGKNGNLQQVRKVYYDAIKFVDDKTRYKDLYVEIHNIFINIIGKEEYEEAESAFENAKNEKLVDKTTFRTFIQVAGKHAKIDKAINAFDEAENDFNPKLTDIVTYNIIIDVVYPSNRRLAKNIFNKYLSDYLLANHIKNGNIYDFHKLSHGAAKCVLDDVYYELLNFNSIIIIHGRGFHREDNSNPMKETVLEWIQNKNNVEIVQQKGGSIEIEYKNSNPRGGTKRKRNPSL